MKKIFFFLFFLIGLSRAYSQTNLTCLTYGSPSSLNEFQETGYYFNNTLIEYNGCQTSPAIIVAIIDTSCTPWNNCEHNFGQANVYIPSGICGDNLGASVFTCRNREEYYFIFRFNDPVQMDSLNSMLSSIPPDYYILAYTWFTEIYSSIPNFKTAFQNLGATQITSLPDTFPYIFFMQSGQAGSIIEKTGTHRADTLLLSSNLNCVFSSIDEGMEPKYGSFAISQSYPNPATDAFYIDVLFNKPTIISIDIIDIFGRVVYREMKGKMASGLQTFLLPTAALSKGVYYYLVQGTDMNTGGKLLVE
jgi:hypothetical protein